MFLFVALVMFSIVYAGTIFRPWPDHFEFISLVMVSMV